MTMGKKKGLKWELVGGLVLVFVIISTNLVSAQTYNFLGNLRDNEIGYARTDSRILIHDNYFEFKVNGNIYLTLPYAGEYNATIYYDPGPNDNMPLCYINQDNQWSCIDLPRGWSRRNISFTTYQPFIYIQGKPKWGVGGYQKFYRTSNFTLVNPIYDNLNHTEGGIGTFYTINDYHGDRTGDITQIIKCDGSETELDVENNVNITYYSRVWRPSCVATSGDGICEVQVTTKDHNNESDYVKYSYHIYLTEKRQIQFTSEYPSSDATVCVKYGSLVTFSVDIDDERRLKTDKAHSFRWYVDDTEIKTASNTEEIEFSTNGTYTVKVVVLLSCDETIEKEWTVKVGDNECGYGSSGFHDPTGETYNFLGNFRDNDMGYARTDSRILITTDFFEFKVNGRVYLTLPYAGEYNASINYDPGPNDNMPLCYINQDNQWSCIDLPRGWSRRNISFTTYQPFIYIQGKPKWGVGGYQKFYRDSNFTHVNPIYDNLNHTEGGTGTFYTINDYNGDRSGDLEHFIKCGDSQTELSIEDNLNTSYYHRTWRPSCDSTTTDGVCEIIVLDQDSNNKSDHILYSYHIYLTEKRQIQFTSEYPSSDATVCVKYGSLVTFSVDIDDERRLKTDKAHSFRWYVDDTEIKTASNTEEIEFSTNGTYTVKVVVLLSCDETIEKEWTVKVGDKECGCGSPPGELNESAIGETYNFLGNFRDNDMGYARTDSGISMNDNYFEFKVNGRVYLTLPYAGEYNASINYDPGPNDNMPLCYINQDNQWSCIDLPRGWSRRNISFTTYQPFIYIQGKPKWGVGGYQKFYRDSNFTLVNEIHINTNYTEGENATFYVINDYSSANVQHFFKCGNTQTELNIESGINNNYYSKNFTIHPHATMNSGICEVLALTMDSDSKSDHIRYAYHVYVNDNNSALPDLKLNSSDIIPSVKEPVENQNITINATIHNLCYGNASNVIVQFFDGEPTIGTQIGSNQTIDLTTAGGRQTVSVEWTAEAGTHNIYVVVDPDNQIEESNEDNNIAFKTISTVRPEISNLMALEKEFYSKALDTINLQGDNLARITADCIVDIFSLFAGDVIDEILIDEDVINEMADYIPLMNSEQLGDIISDMSDEVKGETREAASKIFHDAIREEIVKPMVEDKKDAIDSAHQEFLVYMDQHGSEFSTDRIKECEEGLETSIDALEEAQRFNTGSWNPFERLPFVYLGYRPCQINRVSMAACGYDWADSSDLAEFNNIAYKIPGWEIGALITEFAIKPGIVLGAFSTIGCDAHNIYAGYDYTFSAIKGKMPFHSHSHLIDDSCTTPVSLLSSILSCPANLHAYDSQGRHVGLNETGEIKVEIPNASYYYNSTTNRTEIVIFDSNDTISFEIKALDTGEFNLTNVQGTNETHTTIAYQNVSMETENTTATVDINATSTNYTLNLDSDGDEIVDDVLSPNSTVVNHFPNASIISPVNRMNFTKGQYIAFEGAGTDEEDGELSGYSLIWISSIDGIIGNGCTFRMSNLSAGNHTVSLTAIDSGGLADVSRVSITVLPNCWCDSFDDTDKIAFSNNITVSNGDIKLNNATKGNLTSIRITPFSLQIWDKFYANDTLAERTNITYKILNASDNSTFCTINSTQVNACYCISECASGVDSIRLYAELTTTNASLTPVLHDWNVSWIPEVTPMLTITHAKTDKKTYKLNENVTISCVAQNETGQNISADVVFANITNPDGYYEQIPLVDELVGHYNGTFTNTSLVGVYNVTIYANKTEYVNDSAELSFVVVSGPAVFDTGPGGYPSIRGTHNGTITPSHVITVTKMYTYPCFKTGGHSEFVTFLNSSTGDEIANGTWIGTYLGNYQWIEFSEPFTLKVGVTYNYTIITGSYPQIHHTDALQTANGWINCTKFTDANGKIYYDWIPAIRLCS